MKALCITPNLSAGCKAWLYSLAAYAVFQLLPGSSCGQQIVWKNQSGRSGIEYYPEGALRTDILQNTAGEYLLMAGSYTSGYGDQYAVKVNDEGQMVWQLNVGKPFEPEVMNTAIKTYDGNYFMLGNFHDILLTKFNEQGDTLFSRVTLYDNVDFFRPQDVSHTPDSNYLAACDTYHNIMLVKFNEQGDTLKTSLLLPFDTLTSITATFFKPTPDFSAYYGIFRDNESRNFWGKADTAGNLLAFKQLVLPDSQPISYIRKVAMLPNGNLVLHGEAQNQWLLNQTCLYGGDYGFLNEYDSDGDLVRQRIICYYEGPPGYESYDDFVVAEDSSIYFIKQHRLKKINAAWEDEWEFELDLVPEVLLSKIAQFQPGYLVAAGTIWIDIDNTDIYMCKIALPESLGMEDAQHPGFSLYPNPASAELFIENHQASAAPYIMYDITGQLIQSGIFRKQQEMLDISQLQSGMYLLHLISAEGSVIKKFIKE